MVRKYTIFIVFLILLLIAISVYAIPSENKIKKDKSIEIKENKIIEKEDHGKIIFKENFNLEIEEVEENPNLFIGEDKIAVAVNEPNTETENNALIIKTIYSDAYPVIAINTEELPELSKPATVVFENLPYDETPKILYSPEYTTDLTDFSQFCPGSVCSNIKYDKEIGTLTFDVTGFSSFVPANSDCINFSDEKLIELQSKISERINALKAFHGPSVKQWYSVYGTMLTLTELSKYYWNLDRVDPAPNLIYGIDTSLGAFAESDSPASYDAVFEEFKTWEEPLPYCFTEKLVTELDAAVSKLKWIFIPLPSIKENTFFWTRLHPPFVNVEWSGVKSGSGSDQDLSASWSKTENDFNSKEIQYNRDIDSCWVYEGGTGRWNSNTNTYDTTKQYAICQLKFNFTSLPDNVNIEEAKLFFFMSYGVSGADHSESIGNVLVSDVFRGYNLIDLYMPKTTIITRVDSSIYDVKPTVARDGATYGKGFEGYLAGAFVSPFAENNPPTVEVKFGPDKQSSCPSTGSSDNNEITVCDNLKCTAEISDPDIADTEFTAEFKITGGSGSLSKSIPELKEKGACSGNSCEVSFTIAKEYTNFEDEITCSVMPSDGKINGKEESASIEIAPKCEVKT